MKDFVALLFVFALALSGSAGSAAPSQQASGGAPAGMPQDAWPRQLDLAQASVLVYQPQINAWDGNKLDFRAAVAVKPAGSQEETFGSVFATARTQVDKVSRMVTIDNITIYKSNFPLLPDRGAAYAAELQAKVAATVRTISLDRMETALAATGVKRPPIEVNNDPPTLFVSYEPAILVPIDGAPVLKPLPDRSNVERVVNTRALILRHGLAQELYLHVYDGWLRADSVAGPWTQASPRPLVRRDLDAVAADLGKKGSVDLLDGGPDANPKPSLAKGVPRIYATQDKAELVVFEGQPQFVPIVGTQLLWASNTHGDVLIDTTTSTYYVLLSGRWFRAAALSGSWSYVANNALPRDFANIPAQSLAGAVLPAVAGTPQAEAALIADSIPQTATVPRANGPTFTPTFDGVPQLRPVTGTPLSYVANASVPVIQVAPDNYFAVSNGVWFTAISLTSPWRVATTVPAVIYAIPPSSPLYYVTYVRIYEATPEYVYVGYTPGYLGTVVSPAGTVVYGTGYAYVAWVGNVWYPVPVTYTVAAAPVYNPYVGYTYGFAMGLATAAWSGGAIYHPAYWGGYGCCASASASVYGQWGSTVYSGSRSWYAGGGVAGTTASGNYYNQRTGTSGSYEAGKQFNAYTGNATRGYDRTMNTAAGGSADVARAGNYNAYTGQRSTGSAVSGTTAGGSTYDRAGATTAGPEGYAHAGGGSTTNAKTGQTNTWSSASAGNNHYADVNGNVYRNTGDGWQEHSSSGWNKAGGDSSWADREAQSRSAGEERFNSFSGAEANRAGSSAASRSSAGRGGRSFGGGGGGGRGRR